MTIGESDDKRSLAIGVLPETYDRLEQRAAAVDQTVDQYVFDLVVQGAYARSSFEHLRDALLGWCSGLALGLLAVGYFAHADAVLPAAAVLVVVGCIPTLAQRFGRRRRAHGRDEPAGPRGGG